MLRLLDPLLCACLLRHRSGCFLICKAISRNMDRMLTVFLVCTRVASKLESDSQTLTMHAAYQP